MPNTSLARSPLRAILGPTVFVGSMHARFTDVDKLQTMMTTYLQVLDARLRGQHSIKRWYLAAHETATDAFSIVVIFERAQVSTRLDNVAASFIRQLTLTVNSNGTRMAYNMKRRNWTDVAGVAFLYVDCVPAPEGSFTQAVSATRVEAHRLVRQGSTVHELSSAAPMLPPKPSVDKPLTVSARNTLVVPHSSGISATLRKAPTTMTTQQDRAR